MTLKNRVVIVLAAGMFAGVAGCTGVTATTARGDVLLPRELDTIAAVVPPAATFQKILMQHQIDVATAAAIVEAMQGVFNPRLLRADQPYQVTRTLAGVFREFRYDIDASKFLRVWHRDGAAAGTPAYTAEVVAYPREVRVVATSTEITKAHPSLSAAFDAAGENLELALTLADIFGGEIDFNTELQRGDKFEVLYERVTRDGQFIGYGDVSGAVLYHGGRTITAIRAMGPNGRYAYYDPNGRSLKREVLKSPLKFLPRITSGFSMNRKHPIYGYSRAHLGVDYAAPMGAPVVSVARGTVVSAEWAGDGGNQVVIRHKGYDTFYLHLSAYAAGLHPGQEVEQNEVIGYVGATGAATGPHLDYRVRRNGVFVNPVSARQHMPPGEPIPASMLAEFQSSRTQVLAELSRRLSANTNRFAEH